MDFTAITVAAITALLAGGLVSSIVSGMLSQRWAKKDIQRQKLEDLYLSFSKYVADLRGYWWKYWFMARGETTIERIAEQLKEDKETSPNSFDRARMLAHIYFPDILEHFEKLMELRNEGSKLIVEMDKIHLQGRTSPDHAVKFKDLIFRAEAIEREIGEAVRRRGKEIT